MEIFVHICSFLFNFVFEIVLKFFQNLSGMERGFINFLMWECGSIGIQTTVDASVQSSKTYSFNTYFLKKSSKLPNFAEFYKKMSISLTG